jgi:polyisoprenoid-binding protein YceI
MRWHLAATSLIAGALAFGPLGDRAAAAPSGGETYRLVPAKSRLTAHVAVGGMMKSLGHPHTIAIRDFRGEVRADPGSGNGASLHMTIVMSSLAEVGKEFDEKDRQKVNEAMRSEALEVAKFPQAEFKSLDVKVKESGSHLYQATVKGELTLHGVTHPISFPAEVRMDAKTLHASGEFTVLHSAYGIKRLSAGGGTIKAKDPIRVSFDLVAEK